MLYETHASITLLPNEGVTFWIAQGGESDEDNEQYDEDNDDIWEDLDASKRAKAKQQVVNPGKL